MLSKAIATPRGGAVAGAVAAAAAAAAAGPDDAEVAKPQGIEPARWGGGPQSLAGDPAAAAAGGLLNTHGDLFTCLCARLREARKTRNRCFP